MQVKNEKLTPEDIEVLERIVERNQRWTGKIIKYACFILAFPLFVPIEIIGLFRSSAKRLEHESSFLFFELGPMNVLLYIILPTALIILLIYIFLLKVPSLKRDLRDQNKIVIEIRVKELKELQGQEKKDLWMFSHKITFEPNDHGFKDEIFQSYEKPHFLTAKAFRVHLTQHAKAEIKRETIDE